MIDDRRRAGADTRVAQLALIAIAFEDAFATILVPCSASPRVAAARPSTSSPLPMRSPGELSCRSAVRHLRPRTRRLRAAAAVRARLRSGRRKPQGRHGIQRIRGRHGRLAELHQRGHVGVHHHAARQPCRPPTQLREMMDTVDWTDAGPDFGYGDIDGYHSLMAKSFAGPAVSITFTQAPPKTDSCA